MAYEDFYARLGVSRDATQDEIQRAYKKLARKYHPDVSKEENAEQRFKEIGAAYEVLKDPDKRALYDKYGEHWKAISEGRQPPPGAEQAGFDFGVGGAEVDADRLREIFEQMFGGQAEGFGGFGGRRAYRRQWRRAGHDVEAILELGVKEAFVGGERELALSDPRTGETKTYRVRVPPGVRPGQRIRLAGQGGAGMGGAKDGDLYLKVRIRPEGTFHLRGSDVYGKLPVPYWKAALGGTETVEGLDGSLRVKVPPGTSTGKKIRLKGKGYPKKKKGERGDLYFEVEVFVPRTLRDEEKKLLEKIAALHGEKGGEDGQ